MIDIFGGFCLSLCEGSGKYLQVYHSLYVYTVQVLFVIYCHKSWGKYAIYVKVVQSDPNTVPLFVTAVCGGMSRVAVKRSTA